MKPGSLAGVRILDMATVMAAPLGATLCADHGAEVVKLELPDGSDALRLLQPVKDGSPLWWKIVNRGKLGITLDVRKPEGREIFLKLIAQFDVLVENFRTGTLDRWGLDLATLHGVNPRLVVVRLTGFGQTGPYRHRPGYARVFEAMSGFTNLTGEEGGSPMHSNFPVGDAISAVWCAFSIAAEVARLRGDPQAAGCEVDLAATEALFRLLDPLPVEHEQLGQVRGPVGNRTTYTAPSGMYRTKDGVHVSMVASSHAIYLRLCDAMQRPELKDDARFATNPSRVANMKALDDCIHAWFGAHDFEAVHQALEAAEIPHGKVYTIADVETDPHYRDRGLIVRLPDPDHGSLPAPAIIPRVPGREQPVPRTGPGVGEHNAEVYARIGLGEEALRALREAKVI